MNPEFKGVEDLQHELGCLYDELKLSNSYSDKQRIKKAIRKVKNSIAQGRDEHDLLLD
ncbi:hypothetical protein [Bacillus phage Anath]|uniref:Uncharacterized protein n=1 Tax=Bacillus phage Anath TaxID=2108114 RepID=A0A2P1JUL0_9CAUD|nr:hypothetical protein [Bacillus phage Anath]